MSLAGLREIVMWLREDLCGQYSEVYKRYKGLDTQVIRVGEQGHHFVIQLSGEGNY